MKIISVALTLFLLCPAFIAVQNNPATPGVETRGSGPQQLVLIGCGGCDWRSWETFMERNKNLYTMHAVTLPGLGGILPYIIPEDAKGTPLLDRYAADVASYIRRRGLKNVAIIGHSVGATVTLKVALDHPGVVSKVFLVDWGAVHPVSLGLSEEEKIRRAEKRRADVRAMSDEAFHAQWPPMVSSEFKDPERAPVYLDMFNKIDRMNSAQLSYEMMIHDMRGRLAELKIPLGAVFAMFAGSDPEARRKEARTVTEGARDFQLVFFDETGHWVMEDRPSEFDRVVAEFLSGGRMTGFSIKKK
ncbi:MAG: alpha/beta hydrolase [Blastocatellia bacterium]|nr:alpha/beta hydrolase [Blastocatellia bacterium]